MAASVGPTLDATAGENTWRSSMGRKARPAVSTMPTSKAPTKAPDRADAADDDTDQHQDQDLLAHAHLHRGDRAEQRSGHGGQHGAQREHAQEQQRHAHAHQRGHLPVGRAGAHQHPGARARHEQYRPSAAATPKAMIMRR